MNAIQLDFWKSEEECRQDAIEERVSLVEKQVGKFQRCQFAKIGEIKKEVIEMKNEFEHIKRAICTYQIIKQGE